MRVALDVSNLSLKLCQERIILPGEIYPPIGNNLFLSFWLRDENLARNCFIPTFEVEG